jgi:hypothetical protein
MLSSVEVIQSKTYVIQPPGDAADFRIQREESGGWKISTLTLRARHWVCASYADQVADEEKMIRTDLVGANALISTARSCGFLTEYVGPNATSYF